MPIKTITRFPKGAVTVFNIVSTEEFLRMFLMGDKNVYENNIVDLSVLYRIIITALRQESTRLARTLMPMYGIGVDTKEQFFNALRNLEKSGLTKVVARIDTAGSDAIRVDRTTKPWIITI